MNEKRKLRNEKIKENTQKKTEEFLDSFIAYFRLERFNKSFLSWAENHKKTIFLITVLFLASITFYSFYGVIYKKNTHKDVYTFISDSIQIKDRMKGNQNSWQKKRLEIKMLEEISDELFYLLNKDTLTLEDSIRVDVIFEILKTGTNEE